MAIGHILFPVDSENVLCWFILKSIYADFFRYTLDEFLELWLIVMSISIDPCLLLSFIDVSFRLLFSDELGIVPRPAPAITLINRLQSTCGRPAPAF